MSRGLQRRIFILLLAAALCLVMARIAWSGRHGRGRFTLWYAESDCPRPVMEGLLALCQDEAGLHIEATAFPDEHALGAAFETGRPDLLFCSHIRAGGLYARGSLDSLEDPVPLPDGLQLAGDAVGSAFVPIGIRLPLLLVNTALCGTDYESYESLLAAADKKSPLASDCWADLLYTVTASMGRAIRGVPMEDEKDGICQPLYNTMAEAAFRGGLVQVGDAAADCVRQGLVPCAVIRSDGLAGLDGKDLSVRLLPPPAGGKQLCPAELMGFALLDGSDTRAAAVFFQWLYGGAKDSEAALAAGLLPVTAGSSGQSAMEKSLAALSQNATLFFPAFDDPFFENRERCELWLREALDLLA